MQSIAFVNVYIDSHITLLACWNYLPALFKRRIFLKSPSTYSWKVLTEKLAYTYRYKLMAFDYWYDVPDIYLN